MNKEGQQRPSFSFCGQMKKIHVHTAFKLHHSGKIVPYAVGLHDVEDDIADHPYTKLHADVILNDAGNSASEHAPETETKMTEKALLQEQAISIGIAIDKRWGIGRLQAEIAAKQVS